MTPQIRVLIADDHPVFRAGLRQVVEMDNGIKIVAEAEDGLTALARLHEHHPDVLLLDVDMPGLDGFDVVRAIRKEKISVGIVFLTLHKGEDLFNEALSLDVDGFVLKDSAVTDIVASIKAVAAGRPFISPAISGYLLNRNRRTSQLSAQQPGFTDLTPTERRILKLLSENKTSKEIASDLFISHRTVENHRANMCQKLQLQGSHALLKFALDHKSQLD